jgi:hypothetical protein
MTALDIGTWEQHFDDKSSWGGGGGGGGGASIGVYKSADPPKFEAKSAIRQWSCLNLDPLKALL